MSHISLLSTMASGIYYNIANTLLLLSSNLVLNQAFLDLCSRSPQERCVSVYLQWVPCV